MSSQDLILHEYHWSGNCYKIRLIASLAGIKLTKLVEYDLLKHETRTPEFLSKINANGKIPVLQVGKDTFIPESSAAMYYIADNTGLIPKDRLQHAEMLQWMFFEQYSHEPNIATLRFWKANVGIENLNELQKLQIEGKVEGGRKALDVMERHLEDGKFFVGKSITLADVALYAYTHVAHESGYFDLKDWPSVQSWVKRVEGVEGYITLKE